MSSSGNTLGSAWKTIGAASLGIGFSQASLTVGTFGLFIYPLSSAFGWSSAEVSLGLTLATLALALATPVAGALVDQFGPVPVMLPSAALFAIAFSALGLQTGELGIFYTLCVLAALVGAGTNATTHTKVITGMFDDRLGLALGITLAGVGLISMLLPGVTQWIILQSDWRKAYVFLALLGLIMTSLVALHYRKTATSSAQAARGLELSGAVATAVDSDQTSSTRTVVIPWKNRNFLILVALFIAVSGGFTATNVHLVPILVTRGISAQAAAVFAGFIGLGLLIGRVAAGALMDRYFAPRVALWLFLLTAVGILGLAMQPPLWLLAFVVVLLGFGTAAEMDLMAFLTARYFQRTHYGKIYGLFYACFMAGAAVGPLLMGYGFDVFESYELPLLINVTLLLLASLLTLALGPYPERVVEDDSNAT